MGSYFPTEGILSSKYAANLLQTFRHYKSCYSINMAKAKAGKSDGKKAKAAEKKLKQEKKGEKTEKKLQSKKNADDSDNEDVDLDVVLAAYAKQQAELLEGQSYIFV